MIERTADNLVKFCKSVLGCGFFYGTFGQTATKQLYLDKKSQYPNYYEFSYESFSKYFGTRVCDCAGLIKWFLWSDNMKNKNPTYKASEDYGATGLYSKCSTRGKLANNATYPGYLVFKGSDTVKSHVGVYIGNNKVIEAKGHLSGVIESELDHTWKYYGKLDFIKYNDTPAPTPAYKQINVETYQVQKGCTCYCVGIIQTLLNDIGYKGLDGNRLVIDCIFGGNTEKAVKDFQKDNKLGCDGIVGVKTWKALLNG